MEIPRPKSNQPIPDHAKKVFEGVLFDVYQWEQKMFDGSIATFEKLKRPDSVLVFPILPDGKIILLEEEQPGREPFIATAGGQVDKGEEILDAAKRELLEETGYEARKFVLWQAKHVTSKIDWVVYIFIAKGLKKVADLKLDAGERIKLMPVTYEELLELSMNKKFNDKEVLINLLRAEVDPKKKEELKKLFDPEI